MAQFREREEDENDGIPVDLRQRACPLCRRMLQPWESVCPADGATPVAPVELGALEDGILGRLNPALFLDPSPEKPDAEHVAPEPPAEQATSETD